MAFNFAQLTINLLNQSISFCMKICWIYQRDFIYQNFLIDQHAQTIKLNFPQSESLKIVHAISVSVSLSRRMQRYSLAESLRVAVGPSIWSTVRRAALKPDDTPWKGLSSSWQSRRIASLWKLGNGTLHNLLVQCWSDSTRLLATLRCVFYDPCSPLPSESCCKQIFNVVNHMI